MGRAKVAKWALGAYFVLFTAILYLPAILMAILSFQGERGSPYFPMQGFSGHWWQSLFDDSISTSHATEIRSAALSSLYLALLVGALASLMSLSLSMAFRRRFPGDGVLFYVIMLALMTPGFLLSLGTSLFWQFMGKDFAWPRLLRGFAEMQLGNMNAARADLDAVLNAPPDPMASYVAHVNRGVLAAKQRQWDAAVAHF